MSRPAPCPTDSKPGSTPGPGGLRESLIWLALGACLSISVLQIEFAWNFFFFSPALSLRATVGAAGILTSLISAWRIVPRTTSRAGRVSAALVCLGLVVCAGAVLPPEPLTDGWLARTEPSPLWYRGGLALAAALPAAFWLRYAALCHRCRL